MRRAVIEAVREPFRALVTTFVPEADALSEEAWSEGESMVENLLARQSATVRRRVGVLVRALDMYARLRCGRRLARLAPTRRLALLRSMQESRILLVRRGIWGLRTLAFLLFYGRRAVHASLGYEAREGGWGTLDGPSAPDGTSSRGAPPDEPHGRPRAGSP